MQSLSAHVTVFPGYIPALLCGSIDTASFSINQSQPIAQIIKIVAPQKMTINGILHSNWTF